MSTSPTDRIAKRRKRGYTLVELMIVVAIVGILAALATYGVRRYITTARSAEARYFVGRIAKAAVAAYERPQTKASALGMSQYSSTNINQLCANSTWVPSTLNKVAGKKYQPSNAGTVDFNIGSSTTGWRCLRVQQDQPMSYRYRYTRNTGDWSGTLSGTYFVARAQGDTDADGVQARFQLGGRVKSRELTLSTELWINNENE